MTKLLINVNTDIWQLRSIFAELLWSLIKEAVDYWGSVSIPTIQLLYGF